MRRQARGTGLEGPGEGQRALPCGIWSGLLCAVCWHLLPFPILPASSPPPSGPSLRPCWMHASVPWTEWSVFAQGSPRD